MGGRAGGGARGGGAPRLNADGSITYPKWNDQAAQRIFDKSFKKWEKSNGHSFGIDMGIAAVNNWYGTNFTKALIAPVDGYVATGKTPSGQGASILIPGLPKLKLNK